MIGIEPDGVDTIGRKCRSDGGQPVGHIRHAGNAHIAAREIGAARGVISAERQCAVLRHSGLCQHVAVLDHARTFRRLARASDRIGDDIRLEDRCRCRQDQAPGIAADAIAILPAHRIATTVEHCGPCLGETLVGLVLDVVRTREAACKAYEPHVARRLVNAIAATVAADQIGRVNPASSVIQRTARDIEHGATLRDDFGCR